MNLKILITFLIVYAGFLGASINVPKNETKYLAFKQNILALHQQDKSLAIHKTSSWVAYSQKMKDWSKLADAYNMLGVIYGSYREFDSSNVNYTKALKLARDKGLMLIRYKIHMNLGMNYFYQANYAKALSHYHEALNYFEQEKDEIGIANALSNIGFCHTERGEHKKALRYLLRAEKIFEKANASPFCARTLNGIGLNYVNLNENKEAHSSFENALTYCGEENSQVKNSILVNLANEYLKGKRYLKAEQLGLRAFQESKQLNDLVDQCAAALILGKTYFGQGKFQQAITYYEEAIPLAKATEKLLDENTIYYDLAKLYQKTKNKDRAFSYLSKHLVTNQRLLDKDKEASILALETKYETRQREKELKLKKAQIALLQSNVERNRFALLSIICGSSLFILGLIYSLRLVKSRSLKREEELRTKLLETYEQLEKLREELLSKNLVDHLEIVPSEEKEKINTCLMDPLSDRELEILDLLTKGKTNKEIANSTFISENTVKFHLKNIFVKLDATNRKEAVNKLVNYSLAGLN